MHYIIIDTVIESIDDGDFSIYLFFVVGYLNRNIFTLIKINLLFSIRLCTISSTHSDGGYQSPNNWMVKIRNSSLKSRSTIYTRTTTTIIFYTNWKQWFLFTNVNRCFESSAPNRVQQDKQNTKIPSTQTLTHMSVESKHKHINKHIKQ